jgi:exosortase
MKISPSRRTHIVCAVAVGIAFFWAYWPTLVDMVRRWSNEPMYSHGYLVPAFAAMLLWPRRHMLEASQLKMSWWGLPFVLAATAFRLAGTYNSYHVFDRFSILPMLVGLCVGLGGWHALRWAWPGLAFLAFMLPLPAGFDSVMARPLQRVATLVSAHVLQTLGFVAETEGNVILLQSGELGVVEACSGLRMFMTFCALSTAMAVLIQRPWQIKIIIGLSAFPLAMICNVVRITLTGIAHETLGPQTANVLFHDVAGWLMIGMALLLLWFELWILGRLFPTVDVAEVEKPMLGHDYPSVNSRLLPAARSRPLTTA